MQVITRRGLGGAILVILILLAACGSSSSNSTKTAQSGTAQTAASAGLATAVAGGPVASQTAVPALPASSVTAVVPRIQGQLTVFAAASLTDAFKQIGTNIEQTNPGTKVTFNFAGSPTLRTQLAQGARADVFAAADEPTMQGAKLDGTITGEPRIFAQNRLVLVVPAAKGTTIAQLQDLARSGLKIVLAQQSVPVGNYARQAFMKMSQDPSFGSDFNTRVLNNVVSQEPDVKSVLSKVQLGEADAGVVYSTDVTASVRAAVKIIEIPDQFNVIARYPIAAVKGATNDAGAKAFIDYVLSPGGQAILKGNGFILANG